MKHAHRPLSALAATAALLAISPASAYTLSSSPGFTTSTAGAVTFATFDGSTPVDPLYATISGGIANGGNDPGAGGNWLGASGQSSPGVVDIVFTGYHSYFGLYWGANDGPLNAIELFDNNTSLGMLFGTTDAPNAYWNITAGSSPAFNRIQLSVPGCCFEVDNLAVAAVPEPMSAVLMGLGIATLGVWRRRCRA